MFFLCLGDDDAIKRIAVDMRQFTEGKNMVELDGKHDKPVRFNDVGIFRKLPPKTSN